MWLYLWSLLRWKSFTVTCDVTAVDGSVDRFEALHFLYDALNEFVLQIKVNATDLWQLSNLDFLYFKKKS